MELKLIHDDNCPSCGAATVYESCRHRHANGQGFEERGFSCGAVLAWSPNFERLEKVVPCPHSADEVVRKAKRANAAKAVAELLERLDVDDWFKEDVRESYRRF